MKIPDTKILQSAGSTAKQERRTSRSFSGSRRAFLKWSGLGLAALTAPCFFGFPEKAGGQTATKGLIGTRLSPYFTPLAGNRIRCELCPRLCLLEDRERGFCAVRENRGGQCVSLVYGNPCILHLDPIERKPFLHVLPGTQSLSVATAGCNFRCLFCQNWEVSHAGPEEVFSLEVPPKLAVNRAGDMGARSIAFSCVEPTVFFEYMLDIARLGREKGLLNMIHSNGFINPDPLRDLIKVLDAAHIDLKGFDDHFYRDLCRGRLAPVLNTLGILKEHGVHVEITNLMIPTKNDDMTMVRDMCLWIREELGAGTPVHFSRFYPLHKLRRLPPTPVPTLEKARDTALSSGLEFVYIGNVPSHEAWNTFCPGCGRAIVRRTGYMVREIHIKEGKCVFCGRPIPGIWS